MQLSERSQVRSQCLNQHHLSLLLFKLLFRIVKHLSLCYYKLEYRLLITILSKQIHINTTLYYNSTNKFVTLN